MEGDELTALLAGRPWNTAFDGNAIVLEPNGTLPTATLPGGMELTLLSPTLEHLRRLKPVWEREVRAHGLQPGVPADTPVGTPEGLESFGPPEAPDIVTLAASPFQTDRSKPNASSIAVLARYHGHSVILSADAYPDVLLASVQQLARASGTERLTVSAFKVPHHGSRANVHRELLAHVTTQNYLFSSNGSRTKHPERESVARVLAEASNPRLLFNYDTDYTRIWDDRALQDQHGYQTVIADGDNGLRVHLEAE